MYRGADWVLFVIGNVAHSLNIYQQENGLINDDRFIKWNATLPLKSGNNQVSINRGMVK